MALNDAVAAIRARAEALWPGIEASVPLSWPNEEFTPTLDEEGRTLPFVRVEVMWNTGGFISIGAPGSNLSRREGHIWAFAFIRKGINESLAHQLVSEMAGLFEGQDFSGVVCDGMQPGGPVDSDDGAFYGQSAAVPFNYDETA